MWLTNKSKIIKITFFAWNWMFPFHIFRLFFFFFYCSTTKERLSNSLFFIMVMFKSHLPNNIKGFNNFQGYGVLNFIIRKTKIGFGLAFASLIWYNWEKVNWKGGTKRQHRDDFWVVKGPHKSICHIWVGPQENLETKLCQIKVLIVFATLYVVQ